MNVCDMRRVAHMSDAPMPKQRTARRGPPTSQAARGEHSLEAGGSEARSPLKFVVLVFALSLPFWLLGAATGVQLAPGLPVSSLMAFCPMMAATILVFDQNKTEGVTALLKRSFDFARIKNRIWYAPIILLGPGVTAVSYGVMRLLGMPLPTPQFPVLAAPVMFFALFIAALGEELGWSAYAIDAMQDRLNAFQTGVLLGVVWAAWHIVPLIQAHRQPEWIAWWWLSTVSSRIIMIWIYNNSGKSVFGVTLYHAVSNVSWLMFPKFG